jgi:hypothetical protein
VGWVRTKFQNRSEVNFFAIYQKKSYLNNKISIVSPEESIMEIKTNTPNFLSYCFVISAIFILRISDLLITFHYTPDLSFEFNPVVSIFGASWSSFIIIQLTLFIFISFIISFYFFAEKNTIEKTGLSFFDFIYVYFHGELKPLHARFSLFPRNIRRHLSFNGFLFMVMSIGVSVYAVAHNLLLINRINWYELLIINYHQVVFSLLMGVAIILSSLTYFLIEYSVYKKNHVNN